MNDPELTDQQMVTAKDALDTAIRDFYQVLEPDVIVTAWVLVSHKVSEQMDAEGTSSVGTVVATGQPFPMTRGLLDVGLEGSRNEVFGADDDD